MNWLHKTYRGVADHFTKVLGTLGAGAMSVAAIDPEPIRQASSLYLGQHAAEKVAAVLFVLVIFRGWYTGRKARSQQPQAIPPPQAPR